MTKHHGVLQLERELRNLVRQRAKLLHRLDQLGNEQREQQTYLWACEQDLAEVRELLAAAKKHLPDSSAPA